MAASRSALRVATAARSFSGPSSRTFTTFRQPLQRSSFQAKQSIQGQFKHAFQRRTHATATDNASAAATEAQSGFAKFWNSPVGPKTVHFWAPIMKWGLVLAGVSDFARPAESLSLTQNLAIMSTGAIWTRWCFVIKPRNVFLAAVNFFLFCVGATQVTRIFLYNQSVKNEGPKEQIEEAASDMKETLKGIVSDPKSAAEKAVGKK